LYRFALEDELLFQYNILESSANFTGGSIHLDLNAGFKDVIYSELSQVSCDDYYLTVEISRYRTDEDEGKPDLIGTAQISLDKSLLGFHNYDLTIDLDQFDTLDLEKLADAISRESVYDLYIRIESSISSCKVDGDLFKGIYAHELLSASFEIETDESDLKLNGDSIETPYVPISQESILLTKTDASTYSFGQLLYDFDFVIDEIRTDKDILYEDIDYKVDLDKRTITLINVYRDYSGYLFADITYKAFEWEKGSVSSLDPIT
ncbi:unnamed protein product, partial [marine sediment metagenome]